MRQLTPLFCIDGFSLPAPDEKPEMKQVIRAIGASALDMQGFYHKGAERALEKWILRYARLTAEEYLYLRNLLPDGDFFFTRPGVNGTVSSLAYTKGFSGKLEDGVSGAYRDVVLEIEEC